MPDNAVSLILDFWKKHGTNKYAGITGLDFDAKTNQNIGGFYPDNQTSINLIDVIEKKFSEQGGFQKAEAFATNTKNNDIINAPKGSPDEVIKIISGQTINKKAKKKPKKITFQNQE